jgi:CBS domain-containing protein
MRIKNVLAEHNRNVVTVEPKTPVAEAARVMIKNQIGAVIVVDADATIAGVLSERDILAAVGEIETPLERVPAETLMTRNVVTCGPEDTVTQAVIKFNNLGIRHLVVVDRGAMKGVLSMRDVMLAFSGMVVDQRILNQPQFATELAEALIAA